MATAACRVPPRPRGRDPLGQSHRQWRVTIPSQKTSFPQPGDQWLSQLIRTVPSRCTQVTSLIELGRPKCYEPAETAAMSLSYQVPDLRKRRRIPTRHSSVFGMSDEPGVCTRMKHPMTKSDANV